ncbi:hypothetical protein AVEN_54363-1 [Araneus ventricosus]|uniref:Uncharacterized protein n=1 Tax=Araneus ventricosus TaxID=182803 RepID=A0A4Y2NL77_ARAVE|nr:hypothetical protein AVEN_54363-1 [Araneus ventricosus]
MLHMIQIKSSGLLLQSYNVISLEPELYSMPCVDRQIILFVVAIFLARRTVVSQRWSVMVSMYTTEFLFPEPNARATKPSNDQLSLVITGSLPNRKRIDSSFCFIGRV